MKYLRDWLYFPEEKHHALFLLLLIFPWSLLGVISGNYISGLSFSIKKVPTVYILLSAAGVFLFNGFLIWMKTSSVYITDALIFRTTAFTTVFLSISFYLSYTIFICLLSGARIVIFEYGNIDARFTVVNTLNSFVTCTSYLTADYIFRTDPDKAYIVRKSRKVAVSILKEIGDKEDINKKDKEELISKLKDLKEYEDVPIEPTHYREIELIRLWSSASKSILNIIESEPAKDIAKKVSVNEDLFEDSVEDLKKGAGDL